MSDVEKRARAWDKVLREYCGCHEDAVGNRPCDNGAICDRCMTKDVQEVYQSLLDR